MLPNNFLEVYNNLSERIKEDTRAIKTLELMRQSKIERLRTMKAPRLQLACEYLAKMDEYKLTKDYERCSKIKLEAQKLEEDFALAYCQDIREWIKEKNML